MPTDISDGDDVLKCGLVDDVSNLEYTVSRLEFRRLEIYTSLLVPKPQEGADRYR